MVLSYHGNKLAQTFVTYSVAIVLLHIIGTFPSCWFVVADICKSESSVPCTEMILNGQDPTSIGMNGNYYCIDDGCNFTLFDGKLILDALPQIEFFHNNNNNNTDRALLLLNNTTDGDGDGNHNHNHRTVIEVDRKNIINNNTIGNKLPNVEFYNNNVPNDRTKEICGVTTEGIRACVPMLSSSSNTNWFRTALFTTTTTAAALVEFIMMIENY